MPIDLGNKFLGECLEQVGLHQSQLQAIEDRGLDLVASNGQVVTAGTTITPARTGKPILPVFGEA